MARARHPLQQPLFPEGRPPKPWPPPAQHFLITLAAVARQAGWNAVLSDVKPATAAGQNMINRLSLCAAIGALPAPGLENSPSPIVSGDQRGPVDLRLHQQRSAGFRLGAASGSRARLERMLREPWESHRSGPLPTPPHPPAGGAGYATGVATRRRMPPHPPAGGAACGGLSLPSLSRLPQPLAADRCPLGDARSAALRFRPSGQHLDRWLRRRYWTGIPAKMPRWGDQFLHRP